MAEPAPGGKPLQMLFAAAPKAKDVAHRVIEGVCHGCPTASYVGIKYFEGSDAP